MFSKTLYMVLCCCFLKKLFKLEINTELPVASSGDPDPGWSIATSFLRKGRSWQGQKQASLSESRKSTGENRVGEARRVQTGSKTAEQPFKMRFDFKYIPSLKWHRHQPLGL